MYQEVEKSEQNSTYNFNLRLGQIIFISKVERSNKQKIYKQHVMERKLYICNNIAIIAVFAFVVLMQ